MIVNLPAKQAQLGDITMVHNSQSFTHKMAAKASWRRNYVTVTPCIPKVGGDQIHLVPEFSKVGGTRPTGQMG